MLYYYAVIDYFCHTHIPFAMMTLLRRNKKKLIFIFGRAFYFICFLDNESTGDSETITDDDSATTEVAPFIVGSGPISLIENDIFSSSTGLPYPKKLRKKRSLTSEYVVELMVVADKKMAEYHGKELHNYVLTLMSIVSVSESLRYCDGPRKKSTNTAYNTFETVGIKDIQGQEHREPDAHSRSEVGRIERRAFCRKP